MTFPGFVVLVCSKSLRQAAEFITKVKIAIFAVATSAYAEAKNTLGVVLRNGSRILAVPAQGADAARGFSPDLLMLDEAAFVPDDVFTALLPSLTATRGATHLISSPNGRQGIFFDAVEGKMMNDFASFRVKSSSIPRIDKDMLAFQRNILGELRYLQEHEAQFTTMVGAFFDASTTRLIFNGEVLDESDLTRADYSDLVSVEVADLMSAFDTSIRRSVGYA
jgi:hypothetical protein